MLRVLSFNVRHAALDDDERWERYRRDAVAGVVRTYRPDVAGIQEAGPDQLASIAERTPGYEWVGAGERTGEYNPVGYRPDRVTLEEQDVFWLAETPNEPTAGWDAAFPRVPTVARLHDRASDDRLTIFNTHFDHQGVTAGRESADLLRERVASEARPAVLVGDLNCTPDGDPYRVLAATDGPLRDARRVSAHGHHGPDVTFTGYGPLADGRRLDYAFVTEGVAVDHHAVGADVDREGRFPSDHLPLFVDLELR
jgi:endonuclease/exonuclease/phosphatase family metal-dependent hydrolase